MFERFTARARRVLVVAQEEARALEHDFIGTEHLLLGMLGEGEGVAARALRNLRIDQDDMRERIRGLIPPSDPPPKKKKQAPAFTPRTKKVLELSLREALAMHHNYIGTEHLLLGLVREGEGVGAQALVEVGATTERVKAEVLHILRGYGAARDLPAGSSPTARPAHGTPAGVEIPVAAGRWAGADPVGSQHYLLALLDDKGCAANRILESFGVTGEAVLERLLTLGVEGTTDEVPRRESWTVEAIEETVTIRVKDPTLARRLRAGEVVVTFEPADAPSLDAPPLETPPLEAPGEPPEEDAAGGS